MHFFMHFLVVPNWRFTATDSDTNNIIPIGLVSPPYLSQVSFEQLAIPLGGYRIISPTVTNAFRTCLLFSLYCTLLDDILWEWTFILLRFYIAPFLPSYSTTRGHFCLIHV
jgi:hypothetical protein